MASQVAQLVKNPPAMPETWVRRSPGGRHGNPLLCSCLGNSQPTEEPGSYGPSGYKTLDTTATSTHTLVGKGREGIRERVGHSFLPGIFLLSIYAHEFLRQFGQKDSLTKAVELVFVKFLIWDPLSVSCAHVVQWLSCVWLLTTSWTASPLSSISSGVCSNSCPFSWWCCLTISSRPSPSPFVPNLSQHQGFFQWVSSSHQVAKVLKLQLQYWFFPWIFRLISFRNDWFDLLSVQGTLKSLLQYHNSKASILYSPTLKSVHDYWKKHGFDYMDLCWQSDVCVS